MMSRVSLRNLQKRVALARLQLGSLEYSTTSGSSSPTRRTQIIQLAPSQRCPSAAVTGQLRSYSYESHQKQQRDGRVSVRRCPSASCWKSHSMPILQLQQLPLARHYHVGRILMEDKEGEDKAAAEPVSEKAAEKATEKGDEKEEVSKEAPPSAEKPAEAAAETETPSGDSSSSSSASDSASEEGYNFPPREYSTPELTADAAKHKEVMKDPDLPEWQNPLHHNNPDKEKMYREDFDSEEEFQAAIQPLPAVARPDGSVPVPKYIEDLADECVQLNMLEMNELVNRMQEHFGFDEGAYEPEGGDGGGEGDDDDEEGGGEAAEEKTAFEVKMTGFDAKSKIKIIKEVRALSGLGLKEAKDLVENTPASIQKGIKKEDAEELKKKLEELGAQVEIV